MKITRNGMEFELTPAELEQAFREQKHNYRRSDAEDHLREWANKKFSDEEHFATCVGFTLDEACSCDSEHFLLDHLVTAFEKHESCELDENSVWDEQIPDVIIAHATNVSISYVASYRLFAISDSIGLARLVTRLYPPAYASLDWLAAMKADAPARFEAAFARDAVVDSKVKIEVTIRQRKRVGEVTDGLVYDEYLHCPSFQSLDGEMVDGKFRFISVADQKGGAANG